MISSSQSFALSLAKRVAGSGVTVNSVLPGPTLSEGVTAMLQEQRGKAGQSLEEAGAEFVKQNRPTSILRRAATGAALRVDGGVIDPLM